MYVAITIERIRIRAKIISRRQLMSVWRTLAKKPFPRVKAFELSDSDFNRVIHLTKCRDDEMREMEEWGRVLSARGTDACVFNVGDSPNIDYVVLIRETPYHDLEEVLRHELSHIVRGDLEP